MSSIDLIMLTTGIAGSLGYLLAWRIHRNDKPSAGDIQRYMSRMVAMEEHEENEHRVRTLLLRSGRTSVPNPQAGPPARISRMVVAGGKRETFFKKSQEK